MAFGNQDNNEKKNYEPRVYSPYKTSNVDGIDPSSLGVTFFRNLLQLSISPKLQNTGDKIAFDHDNAIVVYLTHTKARILKNEVERVLEGKIDNGGVNTGADGLITFSNGKELGIAGPCLIIRKVDQSGKVISSYAYEFKQQYHCGIENFDQSNSNHEKHYYDNIEVEQFLTLLEEYYKAATGAVAYSVIENSKYDVSRINTKINSIAEKLGIEYNSGNANYSNNRQSFFNGNNNGGTPSYTPSAASRQSTLDDLASQLEE